MKLLIIFFLNPKIKKKSLKHCVKSKERFSKIPELSFLKLCHSPLTLLRLHNRVTVYAQKTAQQQSNKYYELWKMQQPVYYNFIPYQLGPSAR